MNPELAALLKAYDAFREAAPEEADRLGDAYELMQIAKTDSYPHASSPMQSHP